MSEQSSLSERSYLKKQKKTILVSLATISVVTVLVIPIIPIQKEVTETRTRNLKYNSKVYALYNVPKFVNVTNKDSIGGNFLVTMKWWETTIIQGQFKNELKDTHTQSLFINAKTTKSFYLPDDWFILGFIDSFTYSVSAPSIQEAYNTTKTEHKSILNLLFGS